MNQEAVLARHTVYWHPNLDCPTSRVSRNKFLLFINRQFMAFYYGSPDQLFLNTLLLGACHLIPLPSLNSSQCLSPSPLPHNFRAYMKIPTRKKPGSFAKASAVCLFVRSFVLFFSVLGNFCLFVCFFSVFFAFMYVCVPCVSSGPGSQQRNLIP